MASRTVLINSVLNALPAHIMQCTVISQKTCKALDRINRNFLWGSTQEQRRMRMVNWSTVTLPKSAGGLGIKCTEGKNLSLLGSFAWRVGELDSPRARILRFKYSA